jgi:F-type H+-transporting ATPase subunit gamma
MTIANDNADNLIEELTREYNKLRQESITNELLDLIGGSLGKY